MDYNPADHSQTPTPMIKLKSSDGEIFQVEVDVAKLSFHVKEMLELDDFGVEENDVISIPENAPQIRGAILGKILQWANHHKDDPAAAEEDEKKVKPTDDMSSWDAEFLKVDQTTLFQMIRAADYLKIKRLLDVTCKKVAKTIEGMTLEEVRRRFSIQNDISRDEEEQLWKENEWCKVIGLKRNNDRSVNGSGMDEILAASLQNMDIGDKQVRNDCFRNSVIVRKVLEHISSFNLLYELQFLNKLWNHEARNVMRKRGDVVAKIWCRDTYPCRQLETFGAVLRQMNVVPWSGIDIKFIYFERHQVCSSALTSTIQQIVDRLPLRLISFRLHSDWRNYSKDCLTLLLMKKLLQNFNGALEELRLDVVVGRAEFIEHFVQDCNFPALNVLKLKEDNNTNNEDYTNYMKALVARAPRLCELQTTGSINLMHNILEGREAVLIHKGVVTAPFNQISDSVLNTLRLKALRLGYSGPGFGFERFNRICPMLLQASSTTLYSIQTDAVLAVPLMCYGISLVNVKEFQMTISYNQLEREPQILRFLKALDFTRTLPNVIKVRIFNHSYNDGLSPAHVSTIIEQAGAVLTEPAPDRAANVMELELEHLGVSREAVSFFTELFPNIEELEIKERRGLIGIEDAEREIPFGSIWKNCAGLRELEVRGKFLPNSGNLDSVFCGIFPEEVAELRQKNVKFLKRVHIVPVMPAITCLKNLKTLTLHYKRAHDELLVDDVTFMFSIVTKLIAFARLPALSVSLSIPSNAALPASSLS